MRVRPSWLYFQSILYLLLPDSDFFFIDYEEYKKKYYLMLTKLIPFFPPVLKNLPFE